MKWNLIRQELRVNRRSFWIAAAIIILFQAMFAGIADTYTKNEQLLETLSSMPQGLLEGFGIRVELMSSFEGWMSGEPYTFYILLLGAFAAIWASVSIAKERDQQTAEALFALPYSRQAVYASKAAAQWLQVTAIAVLSFLVVLTTGAATTDVEHPGVILGLIAAGYLITLSFMGIGYVITIFLKSERAALSLGIGIVLVSFLLNLVAGMSEQLDRMADLSLFTAFSTEHIVTKHSLTAGGVIVTLGIYVCGIALGAAIFKRQDI